MATIEFYIVSLGIPGIPVGCWVPGIPVGSQHCQLPLDALSLDLESFINSYSGTTVSISNIKKLELSLCTLRMQQYLAL